MIQNARWLTAVLTLCLLAFVPDAAEARVKKKYVTKSVTEQSYKLRVSLTDKKNCGFSVNHPEKFLSAKSIERRRRYGLKVDQYDLPVSQKYKDSLTKMGLKVVSQSKWTNTVVVQAADTACMAQIRQLPFVSSVRCVWESPTSVRTEEDVDRTKLLVGDKADTLASYYGEAKRQVEMLGVDHLHEQGWTGKGVTIAVIDGGFYNADIIPGLNRTRVLGTRNFVRPQKSVFEELSHGMMVLSCLGSNVPHQLVGTAPDASFYLLVSEDGESEQLVEEDYWCAAVEYADSLGVDMVTSSLGYYKFDHAYMSHTYRELDGRTALNSRVASLAASRGILLLNSAGNSGNDTWKKIGVPADAKDMLAVGAVDSERVNTLFSSLGNAADGRVKPDVMAMGQASAVFDVDGQCCTVNGTSFSCPIMCGAVACLVQAYPNLRPTTIMNAVRMAGHNAEHPDNIFGYGIPDMKKALDSLREAKN